MKRLYPILSFVLVLTFVLSACSAPAATQQPPAATAAPAATEAPAATTAPAATEAPAATTAPAATEAPAATTAVTPTAESAATAEPTAKPTSTPAIIGTGKTKITIWHQWDGAYLTAISAAFADYVKAHPDVTIDLSKPDDVANALKVAIPAGEGPDIIGWANDKIGAMALAGNIVALDDLGIDQNFLNSTYTPAAVKGVIWQNKIWALPETTEAIALVYNKDVVPDKYLAKNLDDLLTQAQAFQKDTGKVLVCDQGFGAQDAYHVAPIYFGYGVPSYVDDAGKVYMNTPEAIKAATWLQNMAKVSLKENSYDICNASLKEGKVGMWWTGPWAIAAIEQNKINYGILPMGKPFVGIKTMMITKNAVDRGNDKAALDLIKWYTGADVQKSLALTNKTIPAATAALSDPEVQKLATMVGFGEAIKNGVPMANTPYADAQWVPVGDASVAVWNGTQSPADAMAAAQKAIEDAIAQMK